MYYYEGAVLTAATLSFSDQAVVQSRGATTPFGASLNVPGTPPQYDVRPGMRVGDGGSSSGNTIVVRTSFLPSGP